MNQNLSTALKFADLCVTLNHAEILRGVSGELRRGEVTGILGPNGCGKTTLLRAFCRLIKADSGSITLCGGTAETDIAALAPKALARRVSFLPQQRAVPDITAKTLVSHGRYPYLGFSRTLSNKDRTVIQNALKTAGVSAFADRRLPMLSGGERQRVSGEAEQLIEQMMVTANIAAAKFSLDHKLPFLYRVHGTPDPKRVEELVTLLQLVGVPCKEIVKPNPETQDFAAILDRVRGLPCETLVSQRLLRTMEKARYSTEETGHFGLALSDYSHYTSPIRRYPDTSIHRVLSAFVEGMPAEEVRRRYAQFCETSATESSRNEIRALIAERDAEDCYMAEYMSQHIGEHFEGTVSGVTMRGVFVRLENSVEGFVSLDAFEGEDFVYDGLITQRSPKRELTIGTPLPIIVASAYVATGKVDFVPDKEKLDI